jgi:hypothetical protein
MRALTLHGDVLIRGTADGRDIVSRRRPVVDRGGTFEASWQPWPTHPAHSQRETGPPPVPTVTFVGPGGSAYTQSGAHEGADLPGVSPFGGCVPRTRPGVRAYVAPLAVANARAWSSSAGGVGSTERQRRTGC